MHTGVHTAIRQRFVTDFSFHALTICDRGNNIGGLYKAATADIHPFAYLHRYDLSPFVIVYRQQVGLAIAIEICKHAGIILNTIHIAIPSDIACRHQGI